MTTERRLNTLQTTTRSLEIVEFIKRSEGATIGEINSEFEMSKSTLHNHLVTLQRKEYITKEGNTYHIGLKFFHIGEHAITRKPSFGIISQTVTDLADKTGMEVDFSVEEEGRVIVIFDEMGNTTRKGFQLGQYFPIHACAAGKAILAEMPCEQINAVLDVHGMPKQTENTITDREELFDDLERVRNRGYAINNEESNNGIQAVGTTIHDPLGNVVGGLAITDPKYRFPSHSEIGDILLESSEKLEEEIRNHWEREFDSTDE